MLNAADTLTKRGKTRLTPTALSAKNPSTRPGDFFRTALSAFVAGLAQPRVVNFPELTTRHRFDKASARWQILRCQIGTTRPVKHMRIWGNVPPGVILSVMLVFGAAMIIVPPVLEWQWDRGIIRDFGIAVSITAMLGFTIDRWLKTQIARDVFEAALGYILPQEFREEVARIAGFKFLCERHVAKFQIEDKGGSEVRLTYTIERRLINISNGTEKTRAYVTMDEWGFPEKTQIHECRLIFHDHSYPSARPTRTVATITAQSEYVEVPPGQSVLTVSKSTEIRRDNDDWTCAYLSPTRNPEIEVTVPDHIEYGVEFGRAEYPVERERYGHRYIMQGTYFPTQHMRLRWWPKATQEKADT